MTGRFAPRRGRVAALALALAATPAMAQSRAVETPAAPVITSLTLFAGTPDGLWRSQDWGGTWQRVEGRGAEALDGMGAVRAIQPLGPQVYVAGDGGVAISQDFGQTWTRADASRAARCLLVSRYPLADATVFIGTRDGLYRSRDAGRRFDPTPLSGTPVERLEWPGPALVAATGRGVLVSTDGGDSFTSPGSGLPEGGAHAIALSSFFMVDPVLFAAADQGVFRSADGGRSWSPAGLDQHRVADLVWLGPFLYAAADDGVYRSEDAGARWSPVEEGPRPARGLRLLFPLAPDVGTEVFLASEAGVFRSTDGGQRWFASGLGGRPVLVIATFPPPERPRSKMKKGR